MYIVISPTGDRNQLLQIAEPKLYLWATGPHNKTNDAKLTIKKKRKKKYDDYLNP